MLIRTTNGGSKARVEHSAVAHQQPSAVCVTECTSARRIVHGAPSLYYIASIETATASVRVASCKVASSNVIICASASTSRCLGRKVLNLFQFTGFQSQLQFLACASNKSIGKNQQ